MDNLTEILISELSKRQALESDDLDLHLLAILSVADEVETIENIGGWYFDLKKQKVYWTRETYKIYGLEPGGDITPEMAIEFYGQTAQKIISASFNRLVEEGVPYRLDLPFVDSQGQSKWIRTTGKVFYYEDKPRFVYGAFENITDQKELVKAYGEGKLNYKAILDNVNDCIFSIDETGAILSSSRSVEKVFGYTEAELIGQSVNVLMPPPYNNMHNGYMENYHKTGKAKIIGIGRELPAIRKNGERFSMELSLSEVILDGRRAYIGIIKDITERKRNERQLNELAYYDSSTGLLNLTSFHRDLLNELQAPVEDNENLCVFIVDIDKFSQVNLAFGRYIGDLVLHECALRLKSVLEPVGRVYRNSKDQFLLIANGLEDMKKAPVKCAEDILTELEHRLAKPFKISQQAVSLNFSIVGMKEGYDRANYQGTIELLESSLAALKSNGGSSAKIIESYDLQRQQRIHKLIKLMNTDQFYDELSIVLQPQYNQEGKIVCSEALVRWNCSQLGFISPAEFIPVAEQSGHIAEIGYFVLKNLIAAQKDVFDRTGVYPNVSINVSAKQIARPEFETKLRDVLTEQNIPFETVCIEVTESVLMEDLDFIVEKMRSLSKDGIRFSVDDFGTGYSSLSYIKHLPINELKIDKSFIDDIEAVNTEVPIVNAVLNMGNALNLTLVAEGIETEVQADYLWARGCNLVQGYYYSKPVSVDEWKSMTF